ncbi:PD-(D/E)XK nuclease family protein [Desulfurispirillum indicum]|uniref:PDDEXK-like family protein n=1 Tax=Desulfurispirillum indicum TaxID=936456 RepID=UPI001CF9D561|nr:PD-(D/E)XK nuclease family protein [Desulfurispirillum indicum]UCZ56633.1 PD-(D/E)XK nuclease family protein [Desulfurispirillum indicum]
MITSDLSMAIERYFTSIQSALQSSREVRKAYDPAIAFDFSVFDFIPTGENKISEVLAFFLNPSESHAQSDTFLRIFLNSLEQQRAQKPHDHVIRVTCEKVIENNRRIDLLIEFNSGYAIAIENKLLAADQLEQIADYSEHLGRAYNNNFLLIYLSPQGADPSVESISEIQLNALRSQGTFLAMSYMQIIEIVEQWKNACQAERVRWFLADFHQYLRHTITGEGPMGETGLLIERILRDADSVEVAFNTIVVGDKLKNTLCKELSKQLAHLCSNHDIEVKDLGASESNVSYEITFSNNEWTRNGYCIFFTIDKGFSGCSIGVRCLSDQAPKCKKLDPNIAPYKQWYNWKCLTRYESWGNDPATWKMVKNGEMAEYIFSEVVNYSQSVKL